VQNNTVYDSSYGIAVRNASHLIRNNLVVQAGRMVILVDTNASGSTVEYNNMHYGNKTNPVLQVGGKTYDCAGPFPGTGNICAATAFVNVSGTKDTWNLHLIAADTVNKGRGTRGATDDIDRQLRSGATDIGADQIGTGAAQLNAPSNLRVIQ
jgi:hypothetical protein